MKNRITLILFLLAIFYFFLSASLRSDTVYTSDGKELKGIVVEDYKDRLTLSTPDGERIVMKSDIKELYYDTEEENLIKLAEQASERKDYVKAYNFYEKALRVNPDSKRAKDGMVFLQGFLFRKDEAMKEEAVRRQEELEQGQPAAVSAEKNEEARLQEYAENMRKSLGVSLEMKDGLPVVRSVIPGSVMYEAGVREGDVISSVWGKLTGYLSLTEVMEMLLEKPSLELKIVIQRVLSIQPPASRTVLTGARDLIGASLDMQLDGLTVRGVVSPDSGLKESDLVVVIDGKPTRYMPLKNALDMIKNSKKDAIQLTIKRELLIWRKD
jgi:C-terminal processing protease CtpA/Prc